MHSGPLGGGLGSKYCWVIFWSKWSLQWSQNTIFRTFPMEKTERIRHIVLWRIRFVFLKLFKNRTSLPWEMRTENRTFVNIYFCSLIKEVGDCQAFNKLEVL